jgi:hypothetical protein
MQLHVIRCFGGCPKPPLFFKKNLKSLCFYFILLFLHLLTCVYIICPPPTSRKNLFCPLVLWFCWRENIRHNKKNVAFLLVWNKDSYTEKFLALLPCMCVLQPTLVHLYLTSSLLPSVLPTVASAINHIQVLGFLPFPYPSHACSPLSVWSMSNNITAFVC